ncbi:MAG: MotA/TolQ/ExbB proton channel family protein [Isosphaeraceae bacterium]
MNRGKRPGLGLAASAVAIGLFLATSGTVRADEVSSASGTLPVRERIAHEASRAARWLADWYRRTPPSERVTWGGLVACGGLASFVLVERMFRLRLRRVVPPAFTARFVDHLHDGRLDGGQALDHCERNPSPAARVALAAVRRWGRPAADMERAVALAHRVETDRLNRNVGTLRRAAALSALLGVLGTLFALGRALESIPAATDAGPGLSAGAAWGPAVASALAPLSTGLVIATLALVAYDGVQSRVEQLAGALDRLGAETIEAIAMSAPPPAAPIAMARTPHSAIPVRRRSDGAGANGSTNSRARGQNVPE